MERGVGRPVRTINKGITILQMNGINGIGAGHFATDCSEIVDSGVRFAFQPIVGLENEEIVGYEALVRGAGDESAASVIAAIGSEHRYAFDQACRERAVRTAAERGFAGAVHLNCSELTPDNIDVAVAATRQAALDHGLDPTRIVLEFGNLEPLGNPRQLDKACRIARQAELGVLADNVGVGEVGLKRLVVFRPDHAKLDRSLIRDIDRSPRRQAIVLGVVATGRALGIEIIAAGIETAAEAAWLAGAGIRRGQGFLFGGPAFRPCAPRATETSAA